MTFDIEALKDASLAELAGQINRTAVEHGWWPDAADLNSRNFGEVVALMHSELSEALEEWRDGKEMVYYVDGKPEGIAVELVDCVIRIADYLEMAGVDMQAIMVTKMAYNDTRPFHHGGKRA